MDDAEYIVFLHEEIDALREERAILIDTETKCDDYSDALSAIAHMEGDERLNPHLYARRELEILGEREIRMDDPRETAARYRFCWEHELHADAWQAVDAATQNHYRKAEGGAV